MASAGDVLQSLTDAALNRMIGQDIALGVLAVAAGQADEARMLAGAVVVQG